MKNKPNTETAPASIAASPIKTQNPSLLFSPGQVVATPGAITAMELNQCLSLDLLIRHLTGDFGVLDAEDEKANREAIADGFRILSNYPLENGARIWIITEADRSVTTFLLPEEY